MLRWSLAFLMVAASTAIAKTETITVEGAALIANGDQAAAEAVAKQNAELEALRKLSGQADADALEEKRSELVVGSEVISRVVDGKILNVKVKVTVSADALKAAFGAKGHGVEGEKRLLVLATEELSPTQVIGWTDRAFSFGPNSVSASSKTTMMQVGDDMGSIDAAASDAFREAGFDVIDLSVLKGKIKPRPALQVKNLSVSEATTIAEKADADYVLIAHGRAKTAHNSTVGAAGMTSGQADVVARLIRVRDGKVMGGVTQHAAQLHINEETAKLLAMGEAAKQASQALARKVSSP